MLQKFIVSLKHAIAGIVLAIKTERNLKLHLVIAIVVIASGIYFKFDSLELIFTIICIMLIIVLELINTVVERILNFVHPEYSVKVKEIKDMSAGVVLVGAIFIFAIGIILFWDKIVGVFI